MKAIFFASFQRVTQDEAQTPVADDIWHVPTVLTVVRQSALPGDRTPEDFAKINV